MYYWAESLLIRFGMMWNAVLCHFVVPSRFIRAKLKLGYGAYRV
jgi:hypothetical protein